MTTQDDALSACALRECERQEKLLRTLAFGDGQYGGREAPRTPLCPVCRRPAPHIAALFIHLVNCAQYRSEIVADAAAGYVRPMGAIGKERD